MIADLCAIKERPEGWLPHTVYVEEEGEDRDGFGEPVYNQYKLMEILPEGECLLMNPITNETEERHLSEINIDWLVTVLNWHNELTGVKNIEPSISKHRELYAFLYSVDRHPRNLSDADIIKSWQNSVGEDLDTQRYTPDEFATLVNDESFSDTTFWVRFIKM